MGIIGNPDIPPKRKAGKHKSLAEWGACYPRMWAGDELSQVGVLGGWEHNSTVPSPSSQIWQMH